MVYVLYLYNNDAIIYIRYKLWYSYFYDTTFSLLTFSFLCYYT